MYCPGCGYNNKAQSIRCLSCNAELSGDAGMLARPVPDEAAVAEWTGALLEKNYQGRRNAVVGLLLLAGAFVIMRVLISTGMPSFIAFLWTCWMLFGGVIALAEGSFNWFASRDQLKAPDCRLSKGAESIGHRRRSDSVSERDSLILIDQAGDAIEPLNAESVRGA
jgi:hypothetical protein